jgi:hypothetical protein
VLEETHQKLFAVAGLFFVMGLVRCAQTDGRLVSRPVSAEGCTIERGLDFDLWRRKGDGVAALRERTRADTGIDVRFDPPHADLTDFFRNHHFVPLDEEDRQEQAILHVQQQLRRYGEADLGRLLDHVVVVDRIWYDDEEVGGYADPWRRLIFVNDRGLMERDSFHHEIAHLVEAAWFGEVWREDWLGRNREGWKYPCPRDPGCRLTRPYLRGHAEAGFVSSYASTAFAEDFAETFALQVECPDRLAFLAARHERIAAKRDILLAFLDTLGADELAAFD